MTAEGRTSAEIGLALSVAEVTVSTIRHRMYCRLGAVNPAHAIALACRNGIIPYTTHGPGVVPA
jgi:DNA-binding CsgD family transcriptional regulator